MKLLQKLIAPILFFTLSGCQKENPNSLGEYNPKFVVEGWIEENDYPHVILSHNLPFFTAVDSAQLSEVVIRWAKVTVSDGSISEVLTVKRDNNYFPPYVYRGFELKGQAGKTYTLKIEYAGNTLTSTTTIPARAALDSIWFVSKGDNNEKAQLFVKFTDNPDTRNFYKLYTKTDGEKRFIPTLLSNQNDKYFNGKELTIQANRGPLNNLTVKNDPYFNKGDTVLVKFASIPQEGFDFWSSFQDEVMNSSNPLIGSTGKTESNIDGPGVGIWCGYGSSVYKIEANP